MDFDTDTLILETPYIHPPSRQAEDIRDTSKQMRLEKRGNRVQAQTDQT